MPERQVRVWVAADVETVRIGEGGFVAVGRGERDDHLVAGPDVLPAEVAVGGGGPAERHDRRPPAQHLLDRAGQQRRVRAQVVLGVGMLEQRDARAGQAVAQRLVPGHGEQPEHVLELGRRHLAAVVVGLGEQDRHHVIGRASAFLLGEQVGVGVQVRHSLAGPRIGHPARTVWHRTQLQRPFGHRRAAGGIELGRGRVVGILVTDHAVGPVEQQPAVLLRHAQHVGQGEQRQVGGHIVGEVAFPARARQRAIADGPGVVADAVFETGHRPRRERPAQQPAQPGMVGRVHVEHHPADIAERLRCRRVADLGGPERGREQLRPPEHRFHVRVPEHKPEPGASRPAEHGNLLHPRHGVPAPQPVQGGEWHPGDVAGRVEHDLGVRARHARPGNSSMDVASATGVCADPSRCSGSEPHPRAEPNQPWMARTWWSPDPTVG
jgi:hypothetical protein